jgi:glycosyltransferase involved in cell wall biosynthesis
MRICIDFTSAVGDRTGVGTYTRELVRALLAVSPYRLRLGVHAFRNPGWERKVRSLLEGAPRRYEVRASRLLPHRVVLEAGRRTGLPTGEALFGSCDLYHGTNFLCPRFLAARTVATVHDLAFLRYREEVPVTHHYERYLARSLSANRRIIAVSEATRRDLVELLDVPGEKIDVVYEGAPPVRAGLAERAFLAFRERHRIPRRYFLFVGTLEPRKNLVRLLEAAATLDAPPALVLAGREGWCTAPIHAAIARTHRVLPVITPGFVTEEEKAALYRGATAFVYPSLYEGFGLPVLEAFAAGTPVLTSATSALPEVAGDAALRVDPRSTDELRDGLARLAGDEDLRRSLAAAGRERLRRFTFERTARETLAVYERALAGDSR